MSHTDIVKQIDYKGLKIDVEIRTYRQPGKDPVSAIISACHSGGDVESFLINTGLWDDFEYFALEGIK